MSLLDAIGNTPLVQLPASPDRGEIWVKLEGGNPTGSYKDRMALAMVQRGRARPDGWHPVRRLSSTPAAAPEVRWHWSAP